MNLPFISITQNVDGSWNYQWTSTSVTSYRVVLAGVQLSIVEDSTKVAGVLTYLCRLPTPKNSPLPLEVTQNQDLAVSEIYPGSLTIQWYNNAAAIAYPVDEYVAGEWINRKTADPQQTVWVYTATFGMLVDGTTHTYRVRTKDNYGQFSPGRQFSINVLTTPVLIENTLTVEYDPGTTSIIVASV